MMDRCMDLMVVEEGAPLFPPTLAATFLTSLEVLVVYLTVFLFTGSVHN